MCLAQVVFGNTWTVVQNCIMMTMSSNGSVHKFGSSNGSVPKVAEPLIVGSVRKVVGNLVVADKMAGTKVYEVVLVG